jgi:hypothetical protein
MKVKGVGPVTSLRPHPRSGGAFQEQPGAGQLPGPEPEGALQRGVVKNLGHLSKQGNPMWRWLLVEAGQGAAQFDPELRRQYQRLKFRRGGNVALARHRAGRLYWTLRRAGSTTSPVPMPGSPGHAGVAKGLRKADWALGLPTRGRVRRKQESWLSENLIGLPGGPVRRHAYGPERV